MLVEWVLGSGGLNVSVRSACNQRTLKDDGGALVLWAVGGCVTDDSCTCSLGTGGGLDAQLVQLQKLSVIYILWAAYALLSG